MYRDVSKLAFNVIYAKSRNGVIGNKGTIPWHLPEDFSHFKKCTMGQTVIMGRKTWESLPSKFRPLPGRDNIVITRQTSYVCDRCLLAINLQDAIAKSSPDKELWVIGGMQIYQMAVPLASKIIVTEVDENYDGDAFAPAIPATFTETSRANHVSSNGLKYALVTFSRTECM